MAVIRVRFRDDADQHVVASALEDLRQRIEQPTRLSILGRHSLNEAIDRGMNEHISRVLPLALVLILAFQYLAFGRWQAVWVTATVIGLNVLTYMGTIGLLGIPQSVLSSGVPVLLVVSTGSFIEHLLARVYEEARVRPWADAVLTALARTGSAVALAAVTTSLGFLSLATFQIYSIREFGVLAAIGVAIGGALALIWMPALLLVTSSRTPPQHERGRHLYQLIVNHLVQDAVNFATGVPRRRARLGAAAALVVALLGLSQLEVGSNPAELFPRGHPVRNGFEKFANHFGGNGFISLAITAPSGSDIYDPAFLDRVAAFQRDTTELKGVGYATSVVDAVLMRINRKMHADDPASERLPGARSAAAQYLELYRWDSADTLSEMIDDADPPRELVVDVFVRVNDSAAITQLVESLRATFDHRFPTLAQGSATFGGEWVQWIAQNRYIVWGKITNILTAAPLVAIICLIVFRDVRLALLAIVPALYATVLVFGVIAPLGIRLDITSCTITAVALGMGTDFAVHLLLRHRELARTARPGTDPTVIHTVAIQSVGPPIAFDALTNIVGFSVCITSPFEPVRIFGLLICLSMAACLVGTLTLLPGWLPKSQLATPHADLTPRSADLDSASRPIGCARSSDPGSSD